MSEASNTYVPNIYEEELNEETTWDLSLQGLKCVPELKNNLLTILYLQNNSITTLPDDLFPSIPHLMYFDIRDNKLTDIPKSIKHHPSLSHLLLQNNKLTSLPDELGTVIHLKVLQLGGNPLMYPPREVINAGVLSVLQYLNNKFIDNMLIEAQSEISEETVSTSEICPENYSQEGMSYNSVIDGDKLKKAMSIQLNERESDDTDEEYYPKLKGKCPKLAKSRFTIPPHYQSSKYVKPVYSDGKKAMNAKIKQSYLRDLALKKHKELLATRDKILQGRKNLEHLKNWRTDYGSRKHTHADSSYKMDPKNFPYDTNPDFMTVLNREDIEKDLPDKFKKKLVRRAKPTVPRKSNNDVHLALKIKQLFENLEAIDINRKDMTPRTEQKMLLNEIQKISEIKQKLMELSTTNTKSVIEEV
ncbi:unnamed protein product [Chrysodeixis includens]|uniref:Leucine-rich repeat-containing protein 27 n=1 Tax=Chrysodeixis includens TaxID=689277 RepID=A0A9P0BWU4_CHRIL|nr:unnamed protein product [Chrysodeixis includens]